jgi:hypothetical protein
MSDAAESEGEVLADESENIIVHEIAMSEVDQWLRQAQADGKLVDGRVYAGLYHLHLADK